MLKAKNMAFSYHSREILKDVSVLIEPGKVYGFLGRNGSGKTTMLKLLNGLLKPDKGEVLIEADGITLDIHRDSKAAIAKYLGFVPQENRGIFPYRVLEMVVMGRNPHLRYLERPKDDDYEIARDALATIGIEYLWNKNFMEISGGERQMVLMARVIAQGARYLILDEPTSHLDFKNQHQILQLVKRISNEHNVAAIMAMHDPNLALSVTDYILMLKDGEIMAEGRPHEVMTEENLQSLYDMGVCLTATEIDMYIKPKEM